MNYDVITSGNFVRELKRLAKKHLSLKNDVSLLGEKLAKDPKTGTPIGKDCYKIRLAISGKGKSGGTRIITAVFSIQEKVVLLSIYDKAEKENITEKELKLLLKQIS